MEPSTVILLFTIVGSAISLAVGITKHRKIALVIGSLFLAITGVIVVVGYLTGAPQVYTFPANMTSMALPTGICFMVTGLILLGLINEIEFKKRK